MRRRAGPPRGGIDFRRLGKSIQGPGTDTRHWVSWGTVAKVGGDGGPDYAGDGAVVVSPQSVDVDVILEPSMHPVTCRYGHQAGKVHLLMPIAPGDSVLVIIPDGDESMIPKIVSVEPAGDRQIPVGDDKLPLFKNDRALIYADGVPIDLRTRGGARVEVDDGEVRLNMGTKGVARVDDDVTTTVSPDEVGELAASMIAGGLVSPGGGGGSPTPVQLRGGKIVSGSETVKAGG